MRLLNTLRYVEIISQEGSIRRAAEKLAITSTALNRRVLALEDELGYPIFERLPSGVRLNTAGELFVDFVRRQFSDFERVKSQIADLAGVRRGHITISATPEALEQFLPEQIARYRNQHPQVTFDVMRHYASEAEDALTRLDADIAVTFEPVRSLQFKEIATARQRVHVLMAPDHPLAGKSSLRMRDLVEWKVLLPSEMTGLRQMLEPVLLANPLPLTVIGKTDSYGFIRQYLMHEEAVSFQIPIGFEPSQSLRAIPLDSRDLRDGVLHIGQLKNRVLPVASAKFMNELVVALAGAFPDPD